ncbi:MAG TPA: DoxX family protein [Bacteroidia bacterium]|nr:DoxX family protein [Bacteroidia bacterium]
MEPKNKSSKAIHITLWVAQVLLAAMFIMSGFMKVAQPISQLSQMLPWAGDMPEALVRFIGLSELLGGLGLLLPSLLRIKPVLTPVAAVGLALIQLLAAGFHVSRGETDAIGMNIVLAAVAVFIAWGRFKKRPIPAKNQG